MGNKLGRSTESKFTKSTGLYPTCEWDDKAVKKLINKKKIAPRYPGREDAGADMEECPICFLWYPGGLNRSKCCRQPICTECFLQFKKPSSQKAVQCPFCNAYNYSVKYYGTLSKEERESMEQEEQKVIAAQIRIKKEEMERQEEREKEVQAERKKRAEEGPPPAARAPAPPPPAERSTLPQASGRAPSSSQPPRPREHQYAPSDSAEDVYLDRDENFQVDVEELMVMEAIRLSLLESHTQGQRDSRLDGTSAHLDYHHDGSVEHDGDEDEDDISSEDAAYLEAIELGQEENWPATRLRVEPGPPAPRQPVDARAAAHYGLSAAASSHQRSFFFEELSRIEAAMAIEDESVGGVADLITYNQSWFSSLMMTRAEEEGPRMASSPSIHAASSPSALEPASTLSPVIAAKSYPSHRNSLSYDGGESERHNLQPAAQPAAFSPLHNLREHAVTPTRHQKPRTADGAVDSAEAAGPRDATGVRESAGRVPRESAGRVPRTAWHEAAAASSRAAVPENARGAAPSNPPVSPLLFGISPPPAALESLEMERGAQLSTSELSGKEGPAGPPPVRDRDETYELHFARPSAASVEGTADAGHATQSGAVLESDLVGRQPAACEAAAGTLHGSTTKAEGDACSSGELPSPGTKLSPATHDESCGRDEPSAPPLFRGQRDAHAESSSHGKFASLSCLKTTESAQLPEQRRDDSAAQQTPSPYAQGSGSEGHAAAHAGQGGSGPSGQAKETTHHGGSPVGGDEKSEQGVRSSRAEEQGDVAAKDQRHGGRASVAHSSLTDESSNSGGLDTDIGTLLLIGQDNVAKSYFLKRIGYGNERDAIRSSGSASEEFTCRLGDKKFRIEDANCVGDPLRAAAASVRAVVLVLDGDDTSTKAATEIRQLLGIPALLNVPVLLLASRSAGSNEAVGGEGAHASHDEYDKLKRSLKLDDVLRGEGGGRADGGRGGDVELFLLAGEDAGSGCGGALEWLRARVD